MKKFLLLVVHLLCNTSALGQPHIIFMLADDLGKNIKTEN